MASREENALLTQTDSGTPMGELFRRFWIPALLADELPATDCPPVRLRLLGEDLVAFRDSKGRVGVLDAYCAHRRSRLYYGRNEDEGLRCIYHGWKYDVSGQCTDMPSEPPETEFSSKIRLKAYPTREWGGVLWIFMGPAEKMTELPRFEWCGVPSTHRLVNRWIQSCNYLQAVEGEIDPTHAPVLHQWFDAPGGNPLSTGPQGGFYVETPRPDFRRAPRVIVSEEAPHGLTSASYVDMGNGQVRWRVNRWLLPFFSLIASPTDPRGGRAFVPVDDDHTMVFQYIFHPTRPLEEPEIRALSPNADSVKEYTPALERCVLQMPSGYAIDTWRDSRNLENDYRQDRAFQATRNMTGIPAQRTQDACVVERQGESAIADRTLERLGASDRSIIAMRYLLMRAAQDLGKGIEPANAQHADNYAIRAGEVVSAHTELAPALAQAHELRVGM